MLIEINPLQSKGEYKSPIKKSQAGRKANITCLFLLQVSTVIIRQPLFAIVYVTCYNSIVRHALCAIIVLAPFYGCLGNNLLQFQLARYVHVFITAFS